MSGGLSVAVITKNEERHLPRALDSVSFADEIVVVDSGSTDGTLEIARSRGCQVIEREWPGYAAQKNFALDQASCEWVLSLDADEALSPELAGEARGVVSGGKFDVYSVPRLSLFIDRWMRHGGWYPDRQIRLIRRGAARFAERRVHECILTERPVGKLRGDILHYSYASVEEYVARMNTYSSLAAEEVMASGNARRVTAFGLAAALPRKFLEVYLYKRGFLDGRHGFVVAWLAAYGVFLRHAKILWPDKPA